MVTIIRMIDIAFEIMIWLVIIRAFLTWVKHNPANPIFRFIHEITEPIYSIVYRILNLSTAGRNLFPLSPIIAVLLLQIIKHLVMNVLIRIMF